MDLRALTAEIERLRAQVEERAAVARRLAEAKRDVSARRREYEACAETVRREVRDVERLEGGLAALLHSLLGTREDRLRDERRQAAAAHLAAKTARERLAAAREETRSLAQRLGALGDPSSDLAPLLRRKEDELVRGGGPGAERLREVVRALADAREVLRELREARDAGGAAGLALRETEHALASARNWGTFDLVAGGWYATYRKHARVDEAERAAHRAQRALDRFERELRDVGRALERPHLQQLEPMMRFADYFFDGLLVDWCTRARIDRSLASVRGARARVDGVLDRLAARIRELETEIESAESLRQELVEEAR